jgi:ribosomal protein S18 acetylase RimI-like enzyme
MTIRMRQFKGLTDLQPIIDLKLASTTTDNIYDYPTVSDLRDRLAPIQLEKTTKSTAWEEEHGTINPDVYRRAMTQQATVLWADDGQILAYALFAFPSTVLVFQVHPGARGKGIESQILAWGIERLHTAKAERGRHISLWCRCHESETERRAILEDAHFKPLPWRDLRLIRSLDLPVPGSTTPPGFVLRLGVSEEQLERYQDLHRAVFDGTSIAFDYHKSRAYQPDLDLIAVNSDGAFVAFCLCQIKQVTDSGGAYTVGEIGVIGTHPDFQKRGLGRALMLSGLQRLKERGAKSAFLETEDGKTTALHLFTSTGFQTISAWRWFTKEV